MVVKYGPFVEEYCCCLHRSCCLCPSWVPSTSQGGKKVNCKCLETKSLKIFESGGNVNEECRIFHNFVISAAHLVHLQ